MPSFSVCAYEFYGLLQGVLIELSLPTFTHVLNNNPHIKRRYAGMAKDRNAHGEAHRTRISHPELSLILVFFT